MSYTLNDLDEIDREVGLETSGGEPGGYTLADLDEIDREVMGPGSQGEGWSGTALSGGIRQTGTALRAAFNAYTGDDADVRAATASADAIPTTMAQDEFRGEIDRLKQAGDGSVWQGVKNVWTAAKNNPKGAWHEIVAQLPNSGVAMGSMAAGAAMGSVAGPIGSIAGGLVGLLFGNVAIETGFMAQEGIREGDYDRGEVLESGLKKGAVITGVDAATMGATAAMFRPAYKASQKAIARTVAAAGINPADKVAVAKAFNEIPGLIQEARKAGARAAAEAAPTGVRSAGLHGTAFGLEVLGEGTGEYLGSVAAGVDASFTEAAMESLMSIPQSAGTVAISKGLVKSKDANQNLLERNQEFDTGIPDEKPAAEQGPDPWETEFDAEWNRRAGQRKQQAMGRPESDLTDVRIQQMRAENQRQMERMEAPPDYDLKKSINILESNVEKFRRLKRQEESVQALQQRQQAMGQPGLYQPPAAMAAQTALQGFESRQERHLPSDSNVPIIEGGQAPFIPVPGVRQEKSGYYPFADLAERLGGREQLLGPEPETPSPIIPATAFRGRPVFENEVDPKEVNTEPTEAQRSAGNYKKAHIKIDGLDISIENPAGSTRKGKNRTGKEWETEMQSHYGYFRRSEGKDKDNVDVFVKPDTETSQKVFVVDQVDPDTGQFDEHKVILGAETEQEARDIYQSNYEKGWKGLGGITEMDQAGFREWLKDGTRTKQPAADQPMEPDEMVQPAEMKAGQPVTWTTKKGETLTGTLSKKVKTNWFVEKPDGKQTLVPEKQLVASGQLENEAGRSPQQQSVIDRVDKAVNQRARTNVFMELGRDAVPGLRMQEHEEAGQWVYQVARGEATQEEFDTQVEEWRSENRIKDPEQTGGPAQDIEITGQKDKIVSVDMPVSEEAKLMPKEQKKYLMDEIAAAVKAAPKRTGEIDKESFGKNKDRFGTVTIEVPGDGEFTVLNHKSALMEFKKRANKFPATMLSNKKVIPGKSTRATGRRVMDFPGEYLRQYSPKAAPDFAEGGNQVFYQDGWYSDTRYLIKMPKPDTNQMAGDMPAEAFNRLVNAKVKDLFPAQLGAEHYTNPTGEKQDNYLSLDVYSESMPEKDGFSNEIAVRPELVDIVLQRYPDAETYLHKDGILYFKDDGNVVAMVMKLSEPPSDAAKAMRPGAKTKEADPETFVKDESGNIDFGEISEDVAEEIKRQPGKIRLQVGDKKFGKTHIENRHAEDTPEVATGGVVGFVKNIAANYNEVWQVSGGQLAVAIKNGSKETAYIQLKPSDSGDFYTVNSAHRRRSINGELLWSAAQSQTRQPGDDADFADTPDKTGESAPDTMSGGNSEKNVTQKSEDVNDADQQKRKTEHVDWFVNYTEQPGKGRTTETERFDTLKEARVFAEGKHGYIIRKSDGGSDFDAEVGSASLVETFGDFEPSAQEQQNIEKLTGEKPELEIEDFGEKLGGARKDQSSIEKELSDDDILSMPLSKIWPKSEVDSIEDTFVAAFADTVRNEIPNKPRKKYKLNQWVEKVKHFREMMRYLLNRVADQEDRQTIIKKMREFGSLSHLVDRVELLQHIDRKDWGRIKRVDIYPDSYVYDEDKKKVKQPTTWVYFDKKYRTFKTIDQKEVASQLELKEPEKTDQLTRDQIELRTDMTTGDTFINRKGDKAYHHLKEFKTVKEAREYIDKGDFQEITDEWESIKVRENVKKSDLRTKKNRPRTGKDHRKGKDVTPEQFQEAFGFRGAEFGNWVGQGKNKKERQWFLNETYDALMDLADILGIPTQALSLNGQLGIGFGSRGRGGFAAAHYEPDAVVINLTKPHGAGSLAHEWFHALDNYFQNQRGGASPDIVQGGFITFQPEPMMRHKHVHGTPITAATLERRRQQNPDSKYFDPDNWEKDPNHPEGVRPQVEKAFAELVQALDESPMSERSRRIDKQQGGYWSRIIERAARGFESYVLSKMDRAGYRNDFMANVVDVENFERDENRYPYLLKSEIEPVEKAFDNLFKTVKTKKTDKGVALYQTSTDYTPGQGLTLADIQSRFPGQAVFLSPDGSVSVRMKNGMGLKITSVKAFENENIAMAMETGRIGKDGVILGKYQNREIQLNRDLADTITRDHELYHFLAKNLLTKGDRLAVKAKARAYHQAGKFRFKWQPSMEENEANAFAQFLDEREQFRGTPLGRAIQKVVDFFDGLMHIGKASARKLAREVESGKAFERQQKGSRTNQGGSVGKLSTSADIKNATDDIALEYGMDTPKLPKADGILSDPATDSIVQEDTGKLAGNPVLRLFESVADRFERSKDLRLKDLGKRIRDYFDRVEKNAGMWRGALKPHMDKIQKMSRKQRQQFYKDFETYWRHHDNGRRDEAKSLLENKDLAALVKAVKDLYHESGVINQKLGIMVQDEGKWRPIGKIMKGFFWPRVLKKDVSRVLYDSDYRAKHPELWEDMVDALVNDGHIKEPQEALKYLSEYFSGESSNDFFANLEKARGKKLPEMFYDYSVDVVQMYANKWSQRSAQIEFFGQETNTQKDRFTVLLNSSLDLGTKEYIKAVRDTVYNVRKADIYGTLMDYMNIFATATQLGNPGTALLNVVGGTLLNVQHMGIKNTVRAVKDLVRDWKAIQQEGTELGILGKDLLNMMRDLDAPATDMFTPESKIKDVLAKFADITMTWGGYKVTENFIRSTAMVAAKYQLQDALSAWNNDVNSAKSKVYIRNFTKNGIDWKQLARENGAGEETGKYLRKMVNIPQGSYKIDQTPLYVDTRAGRFFFKYQKFGTQVSKMFYDNFFHPFMKAKDPKARTRHFMRMMGYFAYAVAGGSLILTARAAAFGYNDPRPEDEDIAKAFENDDLHRGWGLILSKAWHNMMAASAFGFFGNYIQFGMDIADQQRVKNPLDPPGLATIDAPIELVRRGLEQGRITGKDLSEVLERSLAIYRANKRLTTGVMAELGSEWKHAQLEAARRDRRFIQKTVRQFAEEYDIQKKRTSIGRIGATPMTPINKQLYDALILGNSEQVRQIVSETIRNAKPKDWKKVRASMMASARARQPLSINGTINDRERVLFYVWARKNLSRASYERIRQTDLKYRVAMVQAGLAKKVGVIPPAAMVQSP